ncbi:MAG: hypothetical protein LUE31_10270 [Lachnospiraceae bacterium]|nr:hypothetical protein [Lachnospiraceae bacterium]
MSNNVHIGVCRLCGRNKELTFEHVPPASAFNNEKVKMIPGDEVIKQISNPNIEPWDLSKSYGKYQQRGRGGFYLCADCNSKTGQWYVPQYMEFVHGIYGAMYSVKEREYASLGLTLKNIAPLPIIKQIMTMFCDINEGHFGDDKLIDYLLNKENNLFDYSRYHVYMHIHAGDMLLGFNSIGPQLILVEFEDVKKATQNKAKPGISRHREEVKIR